jgi:hypothetical protein
MFHWNTIPSVPAGTLGEYNCLPDNSENMPKNSSRETSEESGTKEGLPELRTGN